MTRAIVLTRVSSDEQTKNNSPSAQETDGKAYAKLHNLSVVDVLNEDYTGTTIDRPVFNRVLELADAGAIDAVIVQHPDRLGRGPILELAITLLANRGIEVHSTNRGLISDEDDENAQIQNSVDGLVSGIERRNILRRTARGKLEKVKVKQKPIGHGPSPYGYRWEGPSRERHLVIYPEEAKVITLIFEWYVSGVNVPTIANRLQEMGIPSGCLTNETSRKNKRQDLYHWRRTIIHRLLRRRTYVGEYVQFGRKKQKGVKKQVTDEPVILPCPAIVSRELFDEAQERLSAGRKLSQRNNKRYFYLLRCLVRCTCKTTMTGTQGQYYRCNAAMRPHDFITKCKHTTCYHVADVDYTVWNWIEEHVLNEQNLLEGLQRREESTTDERTRLEEQRAYYSERLGVIDTEIDRLKILFTSGLFTLAEITRDKKRLDENRAELEKQIAEVYARLASLGVAPDIAERLLERVRAIKQKTATLTGGGKREILELLDTDVTLYTKDKAPWCHIEVSFTVQQADLPVRSGGNGASGSGNQPNPSIMPQDSYVRRAAFPHAMSSSRLCRRSSA